MSHISPVGGRIAVANRAIDVVVSIVDQAEVQADGADDAFSVAERALSIGVQSDFLEHRDHSGVA